MRYAIVSLSTKWRTLERSFRCLCVVSITKVGTPQSSGRAATSTTSSTVLFGTQPGDQVRTTNPLRAPASPCCLEMSRLVSPSIVVMPCHTGFAGCGPSCKEPRTAMTEIQEAANPDQLTLEL